MPKSKMRLREDWRDHDAGRTLNARDRREMARIKAGQTAVLNETDEATHSAGDVRNLPVS